MFRLFRLFMDSSIRLLYSRHHLLLENLALAATTGGVQIEERQAEVGHFRQAFLDRGPTALVRLEGRTHGSHPRDHNPVASGLVCIGRGYPVSEFGLAENRLASKCVTSSSEWSSTIPPGALRGGTENARFRCLRTNRVALDTTSPAEPGAGKTLADISAKPSRGHRRHGLLHRPNPHIRRALLLFHHCPRAPTHSPL